MNENALLTARIIRTAMERLGVSQSELAKYLKSRGTASDLLTGKRSPSKREIAILRELLGISADILIPRLKLEKIMPEELTLLPCPACGGKADIIDEFERDGKGHVTIGWAAYCTRGCLTTSERGSREEAAALWNALPRAMTWRTEPRLGAWNWWRDEDSRIPRYVYQDGTITIAMQIDRVPYQDICGQWCPIPEPREPK